MMTLVFFLEEPSAEEMLKGVLPMILPDNVFPKYIIFQGKQDMEKHLVKRLRGWCTPDTRFVVIRDQDAADCHDVKAKLVDLCNEGGKPDTLVRVACHELESFFLGDLAAIETGLKIKGLARRQFSRKFRDPDKLVNPVQEINRLTNYRYQKKSGSRVIGPHLQLEVNRSRSFLILISGIKRLLENDVMNIHPIK